MLPTRYTHCLNVKYQKFLQSKKSAATHLARDRHAAPKTQPICNSAIMEEQATSAQNNANSIETESFHKENEVEEKKKADFVGNLATIEKDFEDLKEKFFTDKIEHLKKEYDSIKGGTSHERFNLMIQKVFIKDY